MNIINNLLNRFGINTQKSFFRANNTVLLGQQGAVWLDVNTPYTLYNEIPQIKTPVDKIANMASNVEWKLQNTETKEIEPLPEDLYNLLYKPNPMQSMNQFIFTYFIQKKVYGNQYILKQKASRLSKYPSSLMTVSPRYIYPYLSGKVYAQIDMQGIVSYYEITENGKTQKVETDFVLWSRVPDLDNPLVGRSPLVSLRFPITNTKLAYEYLNVISGKRGAIGMLSSEGKDGMGATPFTPEMKKDVIKQYTDTHGVSDSQTPIIMPDVPTKWTPFSYPTKDLLLLEQIDKNFLTILDTFQINPNLFINSTYENLKHGLIMTYNDAIFPEMDELAQSLSKFIGVDAGYQLYPDFSHISILQNDQKSENETIKVKSEYLTQLVNAGIITAEQANAAIINDINQ
jgi:phage portal protein BeeE